MAEKPVMTACAAMGWPASLALIALFAAVTAIVWAKAWVSSK
jgi:hypothetical protein